MFVCQSNLVAARLWRNPARRKSSYVSTTVPTWRWRSHCTRWFKQRYYSL